MNRFACLDPIDGHAGQSQRCKPAHRQAAAECRASVSICSLSRCDRTRCHVEGRVEDPSSPQEEAAAT